MEVAVPRAPKSPEFQFSRSTLPSPYASAPSSPKPLGNPDEYYYCYTSAPASPSRATAVSSYFAGDMDDWEVKPMAPKSQGNEFDFALGEGAQEELSTADELFDNGRIRSLKPPPPPPRLDLPPIPPRPSSRGLWSPRVGEERRSVTIERGRESAPLSPSGASPRSRRESRSLSPLREESSYRTPVASSSTSTSASAAAPFVKSGGSKKWRLKDLLLFRSASEGRATGRRSKDPLWKYTLLSVSFNKRRPSEDAKSSGSVRSMDGSNSSSIKRGSSGPAVSAHELHYTANRAASEEQRKKMPLPYHRNTLFGCLHFNPAVRSITRGFNSNSFNRSRP